MKDIFIITAILLFVTSALQAQNYTGKNDQKIQIGFNFYGHGTGIKATYDYGLNENFSIGVGANFFNTGDYESKFFVFARGDYHFATALNAPDELDLYLGAELGLLGNTDFGIGGHLGARYSFSNNISGFLEVGNNGAIGIAINL